MSSRSTWFQDARFGMFIHWGPYSVSGRGEMVHCMHGMSQGEYERRCVERFSAAHYDPARWARLARQAGCRYMVLTTKHNDGFCLFNTRTTDWNSVQRGPGRDLVAAYVKACRAAGLKIGFYFSLHDYWQRGGLNKGYAAVAHADYTPAEYAEYYRLVREQLRELFTQYGKIDLLFYDGGLPNDPSGKAARPITAMVRRLQPHVVVNNRDGNPNDYDTPENFIKASEGTRAWESCMTIGPHWWGYHSADAPLKSVSDLCLLLQQVAMGGGNLCLNVGPRADGTIPAAQATRLLGMGRWLGRNGEAIYGSRRGINVLTTCGAPTAVGNRLYLHAFRYEQPECVFRGILSRVTRVTCLAGGRRVRFEQKGDVVRLFNLPRRAPDPVATVYRVEVAGRLRSEF